MIDEKLLEKFEHFLDGRENIINEFEARNIQYKFSGLHYGCGYEIVFIDRHCHDHEFFNNLGYGLVVQPQKFK